MRLQHTKQKVLLLNLMLSAAKYQKSSTKFLLCHHASSNAVQICDFQKKAAELLSHAHFNESFHIIHRFTELHIHLEPHLQLTKCKFNRVEIRRIWREIFKNTSFVAHVI